MKRVISAALLLAMSMLAPLLAAAPVFVDITWMSISNMYYELGPLNIVTDGYITRLPQDAFFGGVAATHRRAGHLHQMLLLSRES